MVVLPLPPLALDVLFTFNIALSLLVVMAVVNVARPLDFGIFPTVLLLATLLRLALNVASTRVVLLHGHEGTGAAGHVIQAFGQFVVGGNYAVGIVVFAILTIINFVVVTKGAGRISEVSARFTLDAMPGKQMAIDADLNAGLINQDEARMRRAEVRAEADFYGSMDGASKFVRGDATAGILILLINIIGGLAIGTLSHGMGFTDAARVYTLLTIGDGLVAQIPALLLSTGGRHHRHAHVARPQDLGGELRRQLLRQPRGLAVAGGLLGVMGLIPGMPNLAFLLFGGLLLVAAPGCCGAERCARRPRRPRPRRPPARTGGTGGAARAVLGRCAAGGPDRPRSRLSAGAAGRQGPGRRAAGAHPRRAPQAVAGAGLPGAVGAHPRQPGAGAQRLSHQPGGRDASPRAWSIPDRELAINPGRVFGKPPGIETRDPAFGMEAIWIEPAKREHAQTLGYTVVDASTVIATHLSSVIQAHAHELLGHEEVQHLLNGLAKSAPRLVEDLVPKTLPLGVVVRVLQGLLAERVPIRNLRAIVETLAEHAPRTQDPAVLQAQVRIALGRQIVQDIAGSGGELPVITLEPELEQLLQSVAAGPGQPATPRSSRAWPSACNRARRIGAAPGSRRTSPRC